MKKLTYLFYLITSLLFFISCEKDEPTDSNLNDFVGFEMPKIHYLQKDATVTIPVEVFASNEASTDRVFQISVDPSGSTLSNSLYSIPNNVTIPANSKKGIINISVTASNLGLSEGKKLKIFFPQQENLNQSTSYSTPDINGNFNVISRGTVVTFIEECLNTKVKLSIKFDNYPEETAWELYNSSNVLISSAGFNTTGTSITGFAALGFADRSTYSTIFCLEAGTYTFVIYDDYGDGMFTSNTVQGDYKIELEDGTILAQGGGDFGQSEVKSFTIQ